MTTPAIAPLVSETSDTFVFLTGRPPIGEFLGFVASNLPPGVAPDLRMLSDRWRRANDHIAKLEESESGIADAVRIGPLSKVQSDLSGSVLSDPIFQRSFQIVPTDIGHVELDRLVVFQKHINLTYVQSLLDELGPRPSDEKIFQLCLPFDHPQAPIRVMQTAQNAFTFMSPSSDLRVLEATLLRGSQLSAYSPPGPVSGVVAIVVGFGSNFVNVVHAENRLVLSNGSHRLFALRQLGITHAPCIIQHVTRREELEVVAPGELASHPDRYLSHRRPPLLKDYFDPDLRTEASVPRRARQVQVSFAFQAMDVPGE